MAVTNATSRPDAGSAREVPAWDLPTRVFKWTLVLLVVAAPLTRWNGDVTLLWHKFVGYALLIAILWRVLWGFAGGTTARWRTFLVWPWTAARYLWDKVQGRPVDYLGHNPLGGYMTVALLALVGTQAVLGLFATDGIITEGALAHLVDAGTARRLTGLHHLLARVLLALVLVHVTVNALASMGGGNELLGITTGTKPRGAYVDADANVGGSNSVALALLALSTAVVLGVLVVFGQNPFN
jgi:cytochrome b